MYCDYYSIAFYKNRFKGIHTINWNFVILKYFNVVLNDYASIFLYNYILFESKSDTFMIWVENVCHQLTWLITWSSAGGNILTVCEIFRRWCFVEGTGSLRPRLEILLCIFSSFLLAILHWRRNMTNPRFLPSWLSCHDVMFILELCGKISSFP